MSEDNKPTTIKEYKEALDQLGIPYDKNAKLAELQKLYDQSQIPFEIVPNQMVKVITKGTEGNDIEGEMELDLLMGSDEVIVHLKDENEKLKEINDQLKSYNATLYEVNEALEAKNLELVGVNEQITIRDAEIATLKDENMRLQSRLDEIEGAKAEVTNLGTGNNIVNISTKLGIETRMRSGFVFTRKPTEYYLTDEELTAIKADPYLVIHGAIEKRESE